MAARKLALAFSALLSEIRAQECAEATYAWCHGHPYHFGADTLPPIDTSSCCGSELLRDPALNDQRKTCLCDTTAGACDIGCCCDTECSLDSLRYDGVFGCTSNGTAAHGSSYTRCSDSVVSVNIPANLREQGLVNAFGGADGLLCIVADNSPARGAFFHAATALSTQEKRTQIDAAKALQYRTAWLTTPTGIPRVAYTLGAPVLGDGCLSSGDAAGCARLAPVLMPAPDANGGCTGQQQLSYLIDVPPYGCSLLPPRMERTAENLKSNLRRLCSTVLNASAVAQSSFAAAPTATASHAPFDLKIHNANTSAYAPTVYEAAGSPPASTFDETDGGTCHNALTLLELRFVVSGAGMLSSATAYLRVDTVSVHALHSLRAFYGAAFAYTLESPEEISAVRRTSGRPGYQRGLPLLIADGQDVRTAGLQLLPRSATGACSSGNEPTTPVRFGEDLAVSCTATYSADEFATMCAARTVLSDQVPFATLNLTEVGPKATRIGVYGDSHPSLSEDWVPLTISPAQNEEGTTTSWNPSTREYTILKSLSCTRQAFSLCTPWASRSRARAFMLTECVSVTVLLLHSRMRECAQRHSSARALLGSRFSQRPGRQGAWRRGAVCHAHCRRWSKTARAAFSNSSHGNCDSDLRTP